MNAPCIHYPACGGCQLQHLAEAEYRAHKQASLKELFPQQEIRWVWGAPARRRRAEWQVDPSSGELGFFAAKSREVVPVTECPAIVPAMQHLLQPMRQLALRHKPKSIQVTIADEGVELHLEAKKKPPFAAIVAFATENKIARMVVNGETVLEHAPVIMHLDGLKVRLPVAAFLQPSVEGQEALRAEVRNLVPKAKAIAEFFCGIGTFSFLLAKVAPVRAYELAEGAVGAMQGLHPKVKATARNLETFPVSAMEMNDIDVAVLNPPRAGAGPQVKEIGKAKSIRQVVMVSCHPHTLRRDITILEKAGFAIEQMVAVDQFHWTHHIETVVSMRRA